MVLDDVSQRSHAVVEAAAALDAERLREGGLHGFDVMPVPDRLEDLVGEAQVHDVLHGLLAQEMVDPVDGPRPARGGAARSAPEPMRGRGRRASRRRREPSSRGPPARATRRSDRRAKAAWRDRRPASATGPTPRPTARRRMGLRRPQRGRRAAWRSARRRPRRSTPPRVLSTREPWPGSRPMSAPACPHRSRRTGARPSARADTGRGSSSGVPDRP